jgi:hypothetical protein
MTRLTRRRRSTKAPGKSLPVVRDYPPGACRRFLKRLNPDEGFKKRNDDRYALGVRARERHFAVDFCRSARFNSDTFAAMNTA